jgi:hypothetical protein
MLPEKTEHISVDDASSESAGMPCFIDWQAVKSPRRGFLTPQDELTLVCDLTVFGNQVREKFFLFVSNIFNSSKNEKGLFRK